MRRHRTTRLGAPVLGLVLVLAGCAGQEVEEDPRGALRDAIMEFRDYDGVELVIGAQLDETAQQSALRDGELSEEELTVLTDSTLTVRGVEGDGDDDGTSELVLVVGEETVATVRALADYELYALVDLPAIERVATALDAGPGFAQGISEFEQMAGLFGLGQIASAAREAEWIRVAGLREMVEATGAAQAADDQPDDAELEQIGRELGERLLAFLEDDDVEVAHLGDDDVGERVRVTAAGAQLRELALDVIEALDEVTDGATDPTGMTPGTAELRSELEESISDDVRLSFDAWIDDGHISQLAVDVFELARMGDQPDVPDGEFLLAVGIAEFAGPIDAPDAEVTFDVFETFGAVMDGLGDLGGLGAEPDRAPADPDPGVAEEEPEAGLDEDVCIPEEQAEQLLQGMGEDPHDLDPDEIEAIVGVPVC